jgi:hypothetical protein
VQKLAYRLVEPVARVAVEPGQARRKAKQTVAQLPESCSEFPLEFGAVNQLAGLNGALTLKRVSFEPQLARPLLAHPRRRRAAPRRRAGPKMRGVAPKRFLNRKGLGRLRDDATARKLAHRLRTHAKQRRKPVRRRIVFHSETLKLSLL